MKLMLRAAAVTLAVGITPLAGAADSQGIASINSRCTPCHGEAGRSTDPDVPRLNGQQAAYLAKSLRDYRSGHRPHADMQRVTEGMSDTDIHAMANYFAHQPL